MSLLKEGMASVYGIEIKWVSLKRKQVEGKCKQWLKEKWEHSNEKRKRK